MDGGPDIPAIDRIIAAVVLSAAAVTLVAAPLLAAGWALEAGWQSLRFALFIVTTVAASCLGCCAAGFVIRRLCPGGAGRGPKC